MTKEEKIKEAYGSHFDFLKKHINVNGWCNYWPVKIGACHKKREYWRPNTLKGIQNNNGWIKIESEDDLPKKEGTFYVYDGVNVTTAFYRYYSKDFQFVEGISARPTHYQPIQKPQPPIY